jgi:hypothetical protein
MTRASPALRSDGQDSRSGFPEFGVRSSTTNIRDPDRSQLIRCAQNCCVKIPNKTAEPRLFRGKPDFYL